MYYIEADVDRAIDALARYINEHDDEGLPKDTHVGQAYDILQAALDRSRKCADAPRA